MTQRSWRVLSLVLISALLVAKLMPNAWKTSMMPLWAAPLDVSLMAHILSFAAVTFALSKAFRTARAWQILGVALMLTLLTEGLQFFAIERHPSLTSVVLDMIGASLGLCIGLWLAPAMPEASRVD